MLNDVSMSCDAHTLSKNLHALACQPMRLGLQQGDDRAKRI